MPYRWTGFTVLPLLVTYRDSAGGSGQLLHQMLTKAGLTEMETPHDQIRVEFNHYGQVDLCLLKAAEDGHD